MTFFGLVKVWLNGILGQRIAIHQFEPPLAIENGEVLVGDRGELVFGLTFCAAPKSRV